MTSLLFTAKPGFQQHDSNQQSGVALCRAWVGAHLRVALYQSQSPETPHWFLPPVATQSFKMAALGLDTPWKLGEETGQRTRPSPRSPCRRPSCHGIA